jgi:AraC-like DNA-binding protein
MLGRVTQATPALPYLCLQLRIDSRRVAQLMADMHLAAPAATPETRAISLSPVTSALLESTLRLVRLLDAPQDVPILAPLIEREILYWLLLGDQGARLRDIAVMNSQSHQITRAIEWLRTHYTCPLRVDELARTAGMSVSSFHLHFKAMTTMSPLQYQKQLRLHEARRLLLTERLDAASASYRVGYTSPSHFSREYRRYYGAPPLRHVANQR